MMSRADTSGPLSDSTVPTVDGSKGGGSSSPGLASVQVRETCAHQWLDQAPDAIFQFDPQLRHVYVNAAAARALALPASEIEGKTHSGLGIDPTLAATWRETLEQVLTSGRERTVSLNLSTGTQEVRVAAVKGEGGRVVGAVAVGRSEMDWSHDPTCYAGNRERFLATAAHEFRTLLTRLMLLGSSLARGLKSKKLEPLQAIRQAEAITDHAQAMMNAMAQLVEAPQMAAGLLPLSLESADLAELVRANVANVSKSAKTSEPIELRLQSGVTGLWDPARIEQIVRNLLSNAQRFGQGRAISVTLEADSSSAWLAVEDHGIGIDPADIANIFEKFARPSQNGYGGFGIGLWIVHQVVKAMGGSVNARSALGEGSTFMVVLPRRSSVTDEPASLSRS